MSKNNPKNYQESILLSELNESRMEIAAGKGKVLKSLKDLYNN